MEDMLQYNNNISISASTVVKEEVYLYKTWINLW